MPAYIRSQVHPANLDEGQVVLIPTFRVPVQVHTRSANAKWLDEIAHTNPLWINPLDAGPGRDVQGSASREIRVEVDPDALRAYGLSPAQVASALDRENAEVPAGRIKKGDVEKDVRITGRITDPMAVSDVIPAEVSPIVRPNSATPIPPGTGMMLASSETLMLTTSSSLRST